MELDLTGIDVLAARMGFYLLAALVVGLVFGWCCAAPRKTD